MRPPLVSIIIPCWNARAYIAEAIDSALAQSYPHTEVIVVDDGSEDGSRDVIKSYGPRIRVHVGPNRGGSAARNSGLKLARGEHVLFLDADDVLFPHMVETLVAVARAHPGRVPMCDREDHFVGSEPRVVPHRNRYDGRDPLIFFLGQSPQTSSLLHRRKSIDGVGRFDETLPCCQETDLHLRLATKGMKLIAVPEVLFKVRRRSGSVSADYAKVLRQRLPIFLRLHAELGRSNKLLPERNSAIARTLARDARHLVRAGDPVAARANFTAAAQIARHGDRLAFGNPLTRTAAALIGAQHTETLLYHAVRLMR